MPQVQEKDDISEDSAISVEKSNSKRRPESKSDGGNLKKQRNSFRSIDGDSSSEGGDDVKPPRDGNVPDEAKPGKRIEEIPKHKSHKKISKSSDGSSTSESRCLS